MPIDVSGKATKSGRLLGVESELCESCNKFFNTVAKDRLDVNSIDSYSGIIVNY